MKLSKQHLSWEYKHYSPLQRQWEIMLVSLQFSFFLIIDFLQGKNSTKQKHKRAKWLVKILIKLGPTFIKIGQALSTRPDLIPVEYIEEFSELQERVPPFLSEEAISIIERELGQPLDEILVEFERARIVAASLGQVHRAVLQTGEAVVVKVQRLSLIHI